jgi:predicted amidophosphoribosyltransferase
VAVPWALDHHPAVDEFAAELTVLLYTVRSVLAVSRRPIYSPLACPSCTVAALRRQAGDKVWRCGACKTELEVEHPVPCECGCERAGT